MQSFAGVDGCRAGWIAVVHEAGKDPHIAVCPQFADLVASLPTDAVIAVDMPIGLPERIGPAGRGPEKLVRAFLAERQSSVFSIPARQAVYALDYRNACEAALSTSEPPRRVSKQAFHIFGKIREIDALLRRDSHLAKRVIEAHPEVAFWRQNGARAMSLPKKIRGRANPAGLAERTALLARSGYSPDFLAQPSPRGAGRDDFLDAAVLALVARRFLAGEAKPFPDPPGRDGFGLPIAIWA